ncbi:MAG: 2-octaprenyl-6-methoxyphenyl hydroxylase, partial [Methyloceanibacter sp.]
MAKIDRYDMIIAGGGFVGMTLALALAQLAPRGFCVALVDAEPPQRDNIDARASALSAASKSLLSVLGIWPHLAAGAQAIDSIEITDSALDAGRREHLLGFDDELRPGEAGASMIENADLHRALSASLA